jgi:large conductance mechanosensitive channel
MPRLADDSDSEEPDLLDESRRRAHRLLRGFIDFAFQGNVLEIAFGLILASMFTALVTSFVSDILLPPLSVLLPLNKNLEEKFAVLRAGDGGDGGYNTLKQAQDDGAVVMAYGWVFLSFLVVCLFVLGLLCWVVVAVVEERVVLMVGLGSS